MIERWSAAPFRPTDSPEDRPLWDAYHRFRRDLAAQRAPGEPVESDAVVEHRFLRIQDEMLHHRYAVIEGDAIISVADLAVARPGSPNFETRRRTLHLDVGVLGPYRRRDIATNWLSLVREAMNLHGASQIVAAVSETDGHGFAGWLGAEVAHIDQEAVCGVDTVDREQLHRWRAAAEDLGIRFTEIADPLLPDQRADYSALAGSLARSISSEASEPHEITHPLAALDMLQGLIDVAGGRHFLVMAHDREGRGLGMADATWSPDAPLRANLLSAALRSVERVDPDPDTGAREIESFMHALARGLKASLVSKLLRSLPLLKSLHAAHRGADAELLDIDSQIGFRTHRIITTYRLTYEALIEKLESVGL